MLVFLVTKKTTICRFQMMIFNKFQVREFKTNFYLVRFYFITRCYSDYLKSICEDIKNEAEKPDLVIMNSGCWDLTRYLQR